VKKERLREDGEGRRVEKWGVGRMPSRLGSFPTTNGSFSNTTNRRERAWQGADAEIVRDLACPRGTLVTSSIRGRRCARSGNREGPTSLCYTDTWRCSAETYPWGSDYILSRLRQSTHPRRVCDDCTHYSLSLCCAKGVAWPRSPDTHKVIRGAWRRRTTWISGESLLRLNPGE